METNSHYPIGCPKRLLDSITVMIININIEYTLMYTKVRQVVIYSDMSYTLQMDVSNSNLRKELQDPKYNIIDITESTSFCLFCMVQSTSPINTYIAFTTI